MGLKMTRVALIITALQIVAGDDASNLPLEHRSGSAGIELPGEPVAQAQRRPQLQAFDRQGSEGDDIWPSKTPDMPQIKDIQVQCEKTSIRVNIKFDRPFYGMVFSKGYYSDPNCIHLAAGSGAITTSFEIFLNGCGMSTSGNTETYGQPNPAGSFVENTVIIQYDPLVQEVWDQARKLRCTWYDYYEKSVTFRPFQVDMINAVTANFLGDNLQCWMQIQVGKGPWSSEVSGIVKIGQTMTMVLGIKDDENKFDMLVRNCVAHDGKRAPIQLVDELGCITRTKIMSKFQKIKNFGSSASVVSYAYFQAFKFPDSMNVHFQCVIQVCRYRCPDPVCSSEPGAAAPSSSAESSYAVSNANQRIFNVDSVSGIGKTPHLAQSPNLRLAQSPNQRVFNVDPRRPGPIPAGLTINEETLDQYSAPSPSKPLVKTPRVDAVRSGANLGNKPQAGGRRRNIAPQPNLPKRPPGTRDSRGPSFPKIPGLPSFQKRLGDLLAAKAKGRPDMNPEMVGNLRPPQLKRLYKRETQEMADIEMANVIRVLSPGDVAFTLGDGNETNVVIQNSAEFDPNNICMSLTSLVGGLVMLLGVLVVASMVASFMQCKMRHTKKPKCGGAY